MNRHCTQLASRIGISAIVGLALVSSARAALAPVESPDTSKSSAARVDPGPLAPTGGDEGGIAGPACQVSCNAPNLLQENEPCGVNSVNAGCDGPAPPLFQILRCHEGYCASSWAFNGSHDTDWFQSVVNDSNNDGSEYVCYTLISEFPAVVEIYSGTCGGLTLVAQAETSQCTPVTLCVCLPAPAQYLVKVYPGTIAGGAVNTGLPCASPFRDYTLEFTSCSGVCPNGQGACCYQIPGTTIFTCVITNAQDCHNTYNGIYQGNGTSCTPNPCAPTGACCYVDPLIPGTQCIVTTAADCAAIYNGSYAGDNTTCVSNPCPQTGACCYQIPGTTSFTCVIVTQQDCAQLFNSTYYGNGSTCTPGLCDGIGACCYQDAAGIIQCQVMTAQQCSSLGGLYQGNGTLCNPDTCLLGACCFINSQGLPDCTVTSQSNCVQVLQGTYAGNGVPCNPDPCSPVGACCYINPAVPGTQCIVTTAQDCHNIYNGFYQGNGTSCTPNPCPATGACCYQIPGTTTFTCVITTQAACTNTYNGTYQGDNTTCNPNPCVTGACCYQVAGTNTYTCIITTQANCASLPNGVYMGNGTICNVDSCLIGACCYQVPGVPGTQCVVTTQSNCVVNLHGNYLGNGVPCGPNTCHPCLPPPPNMVAWWTLDEPVGPIASDSAFNNDGKYMPNLATGPTPGPGKVDNALKFDGVDDYVKVPNSPSINFNCGAFSIDAWIRPAALGGGIVSKWGPPLGYDFSVDPSGALVLLLESSTLRCIATSTGTVVPGVWTHVAVTVSAAPGRAITFYINGAVAGTGGAGCDCLGNNAPVLIGNSPFNGLWTGQLDEIEMFNRVLTQQEIQDIMNYGKCKLHCGGEWETPFCVTATSVTATVQVCNDSGAPQSLFLSFAGIAPIPNTLCNGPLLTGFTVVGPNPITVPAGQCVPVQVQIARPAGLVPGMHSCYTLTVTNTATNQTSECTGSVIRTNQWCWIVVECCTVALPVGTPTLMTLHVENTGDPDGTLAYKLIATGPDMQQDQEVVSLNGLPPGTRYIGNLSLPPGGSTDIPITVTMLKHVPFTFFDILVIGDEDNNGDPSDVMLSVLVHSTPKPLCPGDVAPPPDGDGTVNIDDLLTVINTWGTAGAGDANGDGTVNIDDLLTVINGWGPCP